MTENKIGTALQNEKHKTKMTKNIKQMLRKTQNNRGTIGTVLFVPMRSGGRHEHSDQGYDPGRAGKDRG